MTADEVRECEVCDRPVPSSARGRPRRYCSHACRERAYRRRVAGAATVVDAGQRPPETDSPGRRVDQRLTLERIVAAAVTVADHDGVEALSMRRTAEELGAGVMSLYRHVPAKEQLIDLVVDAVFGDQPLPEPGPEGWRAKLELSARREWSVYEGRPWVVPLVAATTRPPISVNLMSYTDWRMRALDDEGLDVEVMVQIAVLLSTFVQGAALALAHERQVVSRQVGTPEEWSGSRQRALQGAFDSGRLPMVSQFGADASRVSRPRAIFEFGLERILHSIDDLIRA